MFMDKEWNNGEHGRYTLFDAAGGVVMIRRSNNSTKRITTRIAMICIGSRLRYVPRPAACEWAPVSP